MLYDDIPSSAVFLIRLEHQLHRARQSIGEQRLLVLQQLGCTQQHGSVCVMTAGVHAPRVLHAHSGREHGKGLKSAVSLDAGEVTRNVWHLHLRCS